ncbi:hypothetical protein CEB3_c50990 [Peptococcaceae bacterium CEB3]|nr:hypothetical protein CEB3_c50990 [Peptococcaceae bacterium CEB3]
MSRGGGACTTRQWSLTGNVVVLEVADTLEPMGRNGFKMPDMQVIKEAVIGGNAAKVKENTEKAVAEG